MFSKSEKEGWGRGSYSCSDYPGSSFIECKPWNKWDMTLLLLWFTHFSLACVSSCEPLSLPIIDFKRLSGVILIVV